MGTVGFLLLCGGRSGRMGRQKALLPVGEETLCAHIARAGEGFRECIFSSNGGVDVPEGYLPVADSFRDCGPMGGLHAALSACKSDALVCAPCDAPYYSKELAAFLSDAFTEEWDALILQDETGRMHPLMGVYAKTCLPALTAHLEAGNLRMMRLLEAVHTRVMTLPADFSQQVFMNLNTPESYAQFLKQRGKPQP